MYFAKETWLKFDLEIFCLLIGERSLKVIISFLKGWIVQI
eukprot:11916.XXX_231189_231308_1 [CDS] Oithona nana genome sequencing.